MTVVPAVGQSQAVAAGSIAAGVAHKTTVVQEVQGNSAEEQVAAYLAAVAGIVQEEQGNSAEEQVAAYLVVVAGTVQEGQGSLAAGAVVFRTLAVAPGMTAVAKGSRRMFVA